MTPECAHYVARLEDAEATLDSLIAEYRGARVSESVRIVSEGLLRIDDAARFLAVSKTTIYELLDQGTLRSVKFNKCRRIPRRSLQEFAAQHLVEETP